MLCRVDPPGVFFFFFFFGGGIYIYMYSTVYVFLLPGPWTLIGGKAHDTRVCR